MTSTGTTDETAQACTAILDELERAVVGRRRTLELVLIGILAGGHVLLEDLPGLGKTLIARVLGLDFARIQFTPDLAATRRTCSGAGWNGPARSSSSIPGGTRRSRWAPARAAAWR